MDHPSQPLSINDLMYNIQTKLSLLSDIEQKTQKDKKIVKQKINLLQNTQNQEQFSQINLPMQILNKKMQEIISQYSPSPLENDNKKTLDKKRNYNSEIQTATRNIDEIKQKNDNRTGVFDKKPAAQIQVVNQFKENHSELEMSQSALSSSKSSSKILNKFDSIELNYIQKIKALSFKVSFLQQKLKQTEEEKQDIMQSLQTYKALYSRKQQEINKQVQKKLQDIKQKLIEKFSEECRLKYNQYITELKDLTSKINEQRKRRKFFQDQNKVLKLQKQNYEEIYKSLLKKQKQWLKIDIDKTRNQLMIEAEISPKSNILDGTYFRDKLIKSEIQCSQIQHKNSNDSEIFNKQNTIYNLKANSFHHTEKKKYPIDKLKLSPESENNYFNKSKQKSLSKSKKSIETQSRQLKPRVSTQNEFMKESAVKKTKKTSKGNKKDEMSRQELIPFLAKGIQQLKERLKMK